MGTLDDARATIADPDLWHPRKGFEVIARRAILPSMAEVYRHIERHADADTVVASSGIAFGARIAQERLGVPTATVHLQPSIIRSLVDQGMAGQHPDLGVAADVVQAGVLPLRGLVPDRSRAQDAA